MNKVVVTELVEHIYSIENLLCRAYSRIIKEDLFAYKDEKGIKGIYKGLYFKISKVEKNRNVSVIDAKTRSFDVIKLTVYKGKVIRKEAGSYLEGSSFGEYSYYNRVVNTIDRLKQTSVR